MALTFNATPVTTIKAKSASGEYITTPGCTTATITPAQAATQINKLLAIGGKSIVANKFMTRTRTEEAVEDE